MSTYYPLSESMRSIQILVDPPLTQTPNCKLTETIAPVSDHPLYPAKPLP